MNPDFTEALNQFETKPLLPPVRTGWKLAVWLRNRDFMMRAMALTTLFSLSLCFALCVLLVRVLNQGTVCCVLDPAQNVFVVAGKTVNAAHELDEEIAKQAAVALLTRTPKGFRFADSLPLLFSRGTQVLAEQLRQNEQPDFTQRQLHQEPEIARIEVRSSQWSGVSVVVKGVLARTGNFGGQLVEETVPFTLDLKFTRNRDLLRSGRYPLSVNSFTLTYDQTHP